MKAVEVEQKIRNNLSNIAGVIAAFFDSDYESIIKQRVMDCKIFVYDNSLKQKQRLRDVEIISIAREFANDISLQLHASEDRKLEVNKILAELIVEYSKKDNYDDKQIKSDLLKIDELVDNIDNNVDEFKDLIVYFIQDYEVNKIKDILESDESVVEIFNNVILKERGNIIKEYFNYDCKSNNEIIELWDLMYAFYNTSLEIEDYDVLVNKQIRFYKTIGCVGDTLKEIEKDAKEKNILIDSKKINDIYYKQKKVYESNKYLIFRKHDNLNHIFKKLDELQGLYDKNYIEDNLINLNDMIAFSTSYLSGTKRKPFIIYDNSSALYSKYSNEIIIHEILHNIAAIFSCLNVRVRGLAISDDEKYSNLDEAMINYLGKAISHKYTLEYGQIIPNICEYNLENPFDCCLKYIENVFQLYRDEITKIYLDEKLTYNEAIKLCPLEEIANQLDDIVMKSKQITNKRVGR